jgi:hypothetical protein
MLRFIFILFFVPQALFCQQTKFHKSISLNSHYSSYESGFHIAEVKGNCFEVQHNGYILVDQNYDLIRTDTLGNVLWSYNFNYGDTGFSDYVQETFDCGFLIAGSIIDSNGMRLYNLIKTDDAGNIQWSRQYSPSSGKSLFDGVYDYLIQQHYWGKIGVKARQTNDGGYVVLGQLINSSADSMFYQLIKLNDLGNIEWTYEYNGSKLYSPNSPYDYMSHVCDIDLVGNSVNDGLIIYGHFVDSVMNHDYINLIRVDTAGQLLWSKTYLSNAIVSGGEVKSTNDGGFIIANGWNASILILKTDSLGNMEWAKYFNNVACGHPGSDLLCANTIDQTTDHGYVIGCCNMRSGLYTEPVLIKIDSSGNLIWTKGYFRNNFNKGGEICCVKETADLGFAFVGGIGTPFEISDIYFGKTDSNGNIGCYDSSFVLCTYVPTFVEDSIGHQSQSNSNLQSLSPIVTPITIPVNDFCNAMYISVLTDTTNQIKLINNCNSIFVENHFGLNFTIVITDPVGKTLVNKTSDRKNMQIDISNFNQSFVHAIVFYGSTKKMTYLIPCN